MFFTATRDHKTYAYIQLSFVAAPSEIDKVVPATFPYLHIFASLTCGFYRRGLAFKLPGCNILTPLVTAKNEVLEYIHLKHRGSHFTWQNEPSITPAECIINFWYS
jgi:hypothetical protein